MVTAICLLLQLFKVVHRRVSSVYNIFPSGNSEKHANQKKKNG